MASSLPLRQEVLEAKACLLALDKKLEDYERILCERNEQTKQSIDQLSMDYDLKCSELRQEFDIFTQEAGLMVGELCDYMKLKMSRQQRKWQLSLKEKENLLAEVEMWRHSNIEDDDACDLHLLKAKLSSHLHESFAPVEEVHLVVTFSEWCQNALNQLKKEKFDFVVGPWPSKNLELERECRLPASNLVVFSIVVSDEDGHIFIADWDDRLIMEFTELGETVDQFYFKEGEVKFYPRDICCFSKDLLVVCGCLWERGGRLMFLMRTKSPPFLEKQKIIDIEGKPFSSLCQLDEQIFVCDFYFNEIDCFSKDGQKIRTIKIGGLQGSCPYYDPLLRADPTSGNLLGTVEQLSKIFVFNQNGRILRTVETDDEICDFRGNKFGHFYFCTEEGIFSLLSKNILYKFPQKSENLPKIFVSSKKLFVCFENERNFLMKIFKMN